MGLFYEQIKKLNLSKYYFKSAISLDCIEAYKNLAELYENNDKLTKAIAYYIKAYNVTHRHTIAKKISDMYSKGLGVKTSQKRAEDWLKKTHHK